MLIINPFAAGGATDIMARQMAKNLTGVWGQSVVVENRPGASGAMSGFDLSTWFAFFAPAATPPAMVEKISGDMRRVLAQPDMREQLTLIGVDVVASTSEELASFNRFELAKRSKIVKESGAKLD